MALPLGIILLVFQALLPAVYAENGTTTTATTCCAPDGLQALRDTSPVCLCPDYWDASSGHYVMEYVSPDTSEISHVEAGTNTTDVPQPEPEPDPPAEFLSFEEWKARQIEQGVPPEPERRSSPSQPEAAAPSLPPHDLQPSVAASSPPSSQPSPRLLIPLNDRYNYASSDCSARTHLSSPGAKNPSSLLSSKKDRYMLFHCSSPSKWVDIELCDHVRIDTVQLANYEFFSGVFRNVSVWVAAQYEPAGFPEGWVLAGTWEARNVRAVQSFHPDAGFGGFYRYMRVVFEGQYGEEFWCPVSLLRVYGLNEMEEWKRDAWEGETRERREREERVKEKERATVLVEAVVVTLESKTVQGTTSMSEATVPPVTTSASDTTTSIDIDQFPSSPSIVDATPPSEPPSSSTHTNAASSSNTLPAPLPSPSPAPSAPLPTSAAPSPSAISNSTTTSHTVTSPIIAPASTIGTAAAAAVSSPSPDKPDNISLVVASTTVVSDASSTTSLADGLPVSAVTDVVANATIVSKGSSVPAASDSVTSVQTTDSPSIPAVSSNSTASTSPTIATLSSPLYPTPTPPTSYPPLTLSSPIPSPATSSESIYRQIMNRLTLLELNTTLGTRYMEEQSRMMRGAFQRLERGWGNKVGEWEGEIGRRLEGLSAQQQEAFERALTELQDQRQRMEDERLTLLSQVHMLENEVSLEKRLSIAQLCLLMILLLVMTFTRGSRSEWGLLPAGVRSVSRRNLREKGATLDGRSEPESEDRRNRRTGPAYDLLSPPIPQLPFSPLLHPSQPPTARSPGLSPPRTPRPSYIAYSPRPLVPSFSGLHSPGRRRVTGLAPLSARRLAKSSHLHELRRGGTAAEDEPGVLSARSAEQSTERGRGRRVANGHTHHHTSDRQPQPLEEADDPWEDTDMDEMSQEVHFRRASEIARPVVLSAAPSRSMERRSDEGLGGAQRETLRKKPIDEYGTPTAADVAVH